MWRTCHIPRRHHVNLNTCAQLFTTFTRSCTLRLLRADVVACSCNLAQTDRAQTDRAHMHGVVYKREHVVRRWHQKLRKLWKAISPSKLVQIKRLRCLLASIENIDATNNSNIQFGQVLSEIWPPEVFWVSKLMCAGANATWLHADGSKNSKNFGRPYLPQKLSKSGV